MKKWTMSLAATFVFTSFALVGGHFTATGDTVDQDGKHDFHQLAGKHDFHQLGKHDFHKIAGKHDFHQKGKHDFHQLAGKHDFHQVTGKA
ncbi:hypothetical protein ACE1TH_06800 [Shouchella sp. JSM 1781072]|uniref:hypothetical protein n=1 Tax=Bacillaceae TaxID=186817 RepID=UPI000C07AC27|nr:hypothetical protein [Bacillus sp. Marseille-P3800]